MLRALNTAELTAFAYLSWYTSGGSVPHEIKQSSLDPSAIRYERTLPYTSCYRVPTCLDRCFVKQKFVTKSPTCIHITTCAEPHLAAILPAYEGSKGFWISYGAGAVALNSLACEIRGRDFGAGSTEVDPTASANWHV